MEGKWILLKPILLLFTGLLNAQIAAESNPVLRDNVWEAKWITHPEISGTENGVYLFKKVISLPIMPDEFIINISADNRYKLYVNRHFISAGPVRGDFLKWRFETLDIAPFLKEGENVISVKVWNLGELRPGAQFTAGTGLIVQGNSEEEKMINTNNEWKVTIDSAYSFYRIDHLQTYYVTGPGEHFDAQKHPWEWRNTNFDDTWSPAKELENGMESGSLQKYGILPKRMLYPGELPLMEFKKQSFSKIRRTEGIKDARALLAGKKDLTFPANSKAIILLDQGELTNAYPKLIFSNGKDSHIRITYAESLFKTEIKDGKEVITHLKGNRDVIEGKKIKGNYDIVISDGGTNRIYEPLWWRTFRYVELEITTGNEPLLIHEFSSTYTAYPLVQKAVFKSSKPLLADIFKISWSTQKLCAGETFFDCPYYEQLQYAGDTRVQGLITYYASGDTLLWKKSIQDFYDSRLPFGLTQSRYPGYDTQLIPTYSLAWITMLYDYLMHSNDASFIEPMLPAVENILQWFEARLESDGQMGAVEGWNFVDWVEYEEWDSGIPPLENGRHSSVIGLQYVYTIQKAAEIFNHFNMPEVSERWVKTANKTQIAILSHCWDEEKKLVADTPEKQNFSQHANIFAVLTNSLSPEEQKALIKRIYKDTTMAQASYYFRFYLGEAVKHAGLGDLYLEMLSPWNEMLQNGLTTVIEEPEPTRSDCHAWSASPVYHFYTIICGIEPAGPGFNKVKIAPRLGDLEWLDTSFPHHAGNITLKLKQSKNGRIKGQVTLPEGIEGNFLWNTKEIELKSGVTQIDL